MSDEANAAPIEEFEAMPDAPAAQAPAYATGPQPADPRLYKFFWGAMACVIGVLFPLTSAHPDWDAKVFNRALHGPAGTETFFGALIGFVGVLVAAQYWWCMKYRKVKLWPFLVMLIIMVGAWATIVPAFGAKLGFDWKDKAANAAVVPGAAWADVRFWNSFFTHVGPGWLLIAIGSTYFVWTFISALVGLGKKKGPAAAPAARRR